MSFFLLQNFCSYYIRDYETASNSTETTANDHDKVYKAVYSFCEALISESRVIKFEEVRNVLSEEADEG